MKPSPAPPTFSVVTVVLNDCDGLLATRRSLEDQSLSDFEWIVIDGGSTDGTVEALRASAHLPMRWVSESDDGIYHAMNKGVALSRGDYIVFLNAGDTLSSAGVLATVRAHIEQNREIPELVCGGATFLLPSGLRTYRGTRHISEIWRRLPANHQAMYFRRDRLTADPYNLAFRVCGDYYLACSLARQGVRVTYLEESLADFRVGDTSFRSPVRLISEVWRIQREVLGVSLSRRLLSVAPRLVSLCGLYVLSTRLGARLSSTSRARPLAATS
jgi:putative colanic acid biosynthesis glycosyltransferase